MKKIVLPYLDNSNLNIRRAAAKAGSKLYAKIDNLSTPAQINNIMQRMNEIISKFFGVILTDKDKETRKNMLFSLDSNFDLFLGESHNIRMLFMCPNDPDLDIKAGSIKILCRLIDYNSS